MNYVYDFNHPTDHSIGGSSELFRSSEVQLEQFGVGGDFHYDNVRARLMTQFGMYSATTPRNDPSPGHGQWDLVSAYRYISEAYGGYHFDVMHGVNVDAGIFLSYIGLFSYYNFDNWAYQPSYVSSNTPWFFNGVRVQIFPTAHLKIEPWFINGWQAYASANHRPGLGGQIKWTPAPWINIISNNYGLGRDDLFIPNRRRIHTDDSIEVKYFDRPDSTLDKMAFSLTADAGCEYGGGVSCYGNKAGGPKQSFLGFMLYNRFWFHRDLFGLTIGGGKINNPGTLSGAATAYQWRNRRYGLDEFSVLHRESGRSIQSLGLVHYVRLHAQAVRYVPLGIRLPPRERPLLDGPGRDYASGRQHRFPDAVCVSKRSHVGRDHAACGTNRLYCDWINRVVTGPSQG